LTPLCAATTIMTAAMALMSLTATGSRRVHRASLPATMDRAFLSDFSAMVGPTAEIDRTNADA